MVYLVQYLWLGQLRSYDLSVCYDFAATVLTSFPVPERSYWASVSWRLIPRTIHCSIFSLQWMGKDATLWAVPASPQTALVYLSVLQVRVLALCSSSSIFVFGMDSIFSHSYFLIHHSLRNRLMGFAWNVKCQNTEPSTNSIYKAWYKCSSRSDRSICQEHCELRTAYRKEKSV